jgi:hypothetical protein
VRKAWARVERLLLVGRDLDRLVDLSIVLRHRFKITTLAVTQDLIGRALQEARKRTGQIMVCLDERDSSVEFAPLLDLSPSVLFLTRDSERDLEEQQKSSSCLVRCRGEERRVVSATCIAAGAWGSGGESGS